MFKRKLALAFVVISALLLAACGGDAATSTPVAVPTATTAAGGATPAAGGKLKVAFVYVGGANDAGWTEALDKGRQELVAADSNVETVFQENVPETAADAERVIRDFAQKGNKLIFTTSYGFMDPTINVAKDFPDTIFIHISGYKTAANVGTGFAKIDEPRYVSGLIAGKMTKKNVLGYVAAFPTPEVIRGINAFTLGVRHVNPTATVKVVWTNTWYDPQKEGQAAQALLDAGADVMAQHQDSPASVQAAQAVGAYAIGYDSDMSSFAPKAVLTSAVFKWGGYFINVAKDVEAGTWKTNQYWGEWKDGVVDLAPIGSMVPADVAKMATDEAALYKSGQKTINDIFTGPINDQTGAVKVAAGDKMSDEDLLNMSWFVQGVDGTIPQ